MKPPKAEPKADRPGRRKTRPPPNKTPQAPFRERKDGGQPAEASGGDALVANRPRRPPSEGSRTLREVGVVAQLAEVQKYPPPPSHPTKRKMQAHPQKEAQRASSWLPGREPSGYSSASFYDYTSLSSSPEPTSSSGFEYSSSWEESGSSLSQSEPSSVSPASPVALSSLAHGLPSDFEYSSSPIESPSGLESGPSPGSLLRADPGDPASSPAQSSGSEGWRMGPSGVPSPGGLPNPGTQLPHSPPDPATAVGHHKGSSLTRKPLARSTGRRPSGKSSPGKDPQEEMNGADPDAESDLEYPVRRVAYSPQIRLKDLRGDCGCWKDRRNSGKNIGGSLQKTHRRLAGTTPGPSLA